MVQAKCVLNGMKMHYLHAQPKFIVCGANDVLCCLGALPFEALQLLYTSQYNVDLIVGTRTQDN